MSRSPRPVFAGLSWRTWIRQLAAAPSVPASIAVATFITACCLSLGPRIVDHASTLDLRSELDTARADQRNLRIEQTTRLGVSPTGDPLDIVRRQGQQLIDDAPDSVAAVVGSDRFVIDSPRFTVTSYPDEQPGPFPTTLVIRTQEGIDDHLTLIAGELPREQPLRFLLRGSACPDDVDAEDYEPDPDVDCGVVVAPVFDMLISAETAEVMQLDVGDEAIMFPDPVDIRWLAATGQQFGRRFVLRIAGIAELSDPTLEYWYDDTSLHRPRVTENADYRLIFATGLLGADRYRDFLRATVSVPLTYTWRFPVDPEQVTPERATDLANDLERFTPDQADAITQLPELIGEYLDQRSLTVGLMSAVVSGLYAATAGGLAAVALLGAIRHRTTTHLVLDRGGTRRQVLADATRTAAVFAVPAALGGWVLGSVAFPDTADSLPFVLSAITAGIALAATVGAGVAIARDRSIVGSPGRPIGGPARRRAVAELLVVVLALGAVVLVRRRGADPATEASRVIDPLLSVAASVVVLAAALLVVRLVAVAVDAIASAAARQRGAVGFVGTRHASAQTRSMTAAVVVMVGAIAIAAFSTTVNGSIDRTQHARAWTEVGGDYRVESQNPALELASLIDLSVMPDEQPSAAAVVIDDVSVLGPLGGTFSEVTALPTDEYIEDVVAGQRGLVDLAALERLRSASQDWDPGSGQPMPALVSTRWPASTAIRAGDDFTMRLGAGGASNYSALTLVDEVPGVDANRPFVVVDRNALAARIDIPNSESNLIFGRGSRSRVDRLAADVAEVTGQALVHSRYDVVDEVAGDPFSTWLRRSLLAVVVLAGAVAIVAAVAAFEISGAERDRDLSVLRTLGLERRQAAGIAATEQLPTIATAIVFGTSAGLVVAWLLHPALRLGRLAGTESASGPVIDVETIVAVAVSLGLAMTLAIGISVGRLVRRNDGSMLRTGDDR